MSVETHKKIAVNATNSMAIDRAGQLYSWGTTKFGLNCLLDGHERSYIEDHVHAHIGDVPQLYYIKKNMAQENWHNQQHFELQESDVFNLLGDKANKQTIMQQCFTTHVSLGTYHGGVVCCDVDTNYEFKPPQPSFRDILEDLKNSLFFEWAKLDAAELEKEETQGGGNRFDEAKNEEVRADLAMIYEVFGKRVNSLKEIISAQYQETVREQKEICDRQQIMKIENQVNDQIKIEYILRKNFIKVWKDTYPYVRYNFIKNFIEKLSDKAKKNEAGMNNLMKHLTESAKKAMRLPSFENSWRHHSGCSESRKNLFDDKARMGGEWCCLKELRDQILGRRCDNGMLFMFGVSNEGRLGVKPDEKGTNHGHAHAVLQVKTAQLVDFPFEDDETEAKGDRRSLIMRFNDPVQIIKLECGSSFSIALSHQLYLYSWGFGKSGSLGLGPESEAKYPKRIVSTYDSNAICENIVDISCGSSHTLAIDNSGNLYSWGNGQGGRLGHNSEVGENQPRKIEAEGIRGKFVRYIEAGDASSACITADKQVWFWGSGLNGRLGNGSKQDVLVPEISQELKKKQVKAIFMGTNTTFCIFDSGKVNAWGSSKNGKLGFDLPQGKNYELPREVTALGSLDVVQIAPGPFHTLCLTNRGKIFVMGNSKDGKLGFTNPEGGIMDQETPIQICKEKSRNKDNEFTFFCFGELEQEERFKDYNLFSNYDENKKLKMINKPKNNPYEVLQVKVGVNFALFLTNSGEIYSSGCNKNGQLGIVQENSESEESAEEEDDDNKKQNLDDTFEKNPRMKKKINSLQKLVDNNFVTKAAFSGKVKIKQIATGSMHALALSEDGNVYAWGKNKSGQLGNGLNNDKTCPSLLTSFGSENECIMVACGENHSVFLTKSKLVYTCGSNEFGQLGLQKTFNDSDDEQEQNIDQIEVKPVLIEKDILDNVDYISAGKYHTVVIRIKNIYEAQEDEKVDLDNSNPNDAKGKKQQLSDIEHELYSWGRAYHGQLGHQRIKNVQWTPKLVKIKKDPSQVDSESLRRFHMVSCGEKHTLLLNVDGQIYYTGDKFSVGLSDKEQINSSSKRGSDFQYHFVPYFSKMEYMQMGDAEQHIMYINANFNSDLNYAIDKAGTLNQFGENQPYTKVFETNKTNDEKDRNKIAEVPAEILNLLYVDSNRNFKTVINRTLIPYTWGIYKNGMIGDYKEDDNDDKGGEDQQNATQSTGKAEQSILKKTDFFCTICESKIKNPKTLKFCGHTFCQQCINKKEQEYKNTPQFKMKVVKVITKEDVMNFCDKCIKNNVKAPKEIKFFSAERDKYLRTKESIDDKQKEKIMKRYNLDVIKEEKKEEERDKQEGAELQFPVQKQLKLVNQSQFEKDIIQQDTDLFITFKKMISMIYDLTKDQNKAFQKMLMKSQDNIAARVEGFPIQNIDKLENLKTEIPQVVLLNKQMYEVMFMLLQTHPCYLINWIKSAITKKIDLFNHHPLAFVHKEFLDKPENHHIRRILKMQEMYLNSTEEMIKYDEICYLVLAVFGGFKMIRNSKRCVSQIMMISSKIFEFEVEETLKAERSEKGGGSAIKDYKMEDILTNTVDCAYQRLHRLVFQAQHQNTQFIEQIFEAIVIKLYELTANGAKQITDGIDGKDVEDGTLSVFDFEREMKHKDIMEKRAKNVIKITREVIAEIIKPAIEGLIGRKKDMVVFFSNEIVMLSLYCDKFLQDHLIQKYIDHSDKKKVHDFFPEEVDLTNLKDMPKREKFKKKEEQKKDEKLTQQVLNQRADMERDRILSIYKLREEVNQLLLRVLFEHLFNRLQSCRAHDIIKILDNYKGKSVRHFANVQTGLDRYQDSNIVKVNEARKGNNLALFGQMLRTFMCEGKFHFNIPELDELKNFIEWEEGIKTRQELCDMIRCKKTPLQIRKYNSYLIQQMIEQAMELQNQNCTVMLRDVIYIHNQLCSNKAKHHIFLKGFHYHAHHHDEEPEITAKPHGHDVDPHDNPNSDESHSHSEEEHEHHEHEEDEEVLNELDPLQIIFDAFQYQEIVVRVFEKEVLEEKLLFKSMSFQIKTRIFDSFNELTKCRDCNALVYKGLIPKKRLDEGINFKPWRCCNKVQRKGSRQLSECGFENANPLSMVCKKCNLWRPEVTIPKDILFKPFQQDISDPQDYTNVKLMEQILQTLPLIKTSDNLSEIVNDLRNKENSKPGGKNFQLITLLNDFSKMKTDYINDQKLKKNINDDSQKTKMEKEFFQDLCSKIAINIEQREDHHKMLSDDNKMIREIWERWSYIEIMHKKLTRSVEQISKNAIKGIGNEEIMSFKNYQQNSRDKKILAGNLDQQEKKKSKAKKSDGKEEKDKLGSYFKNMEEKQKMTISVQKLQKKLEDNRERRNKMKDQFGQFSSFEAKDLIAREVVTDIKINEKDIKDLIGKCKYLFYEIRETEQKQGGYKVELSFEDKQSLIDNFCNMDQIKDMVLKGDDGSFGQPSQSILCTIFISNQMLLEMRRVMTTKCHVDLNGTTFNIFNLVKLINHMKAKNAMASGKQ